MGKVRRFLAWARIVDAHDGRVSLTSIALMLILFKLAIVPVTSIADVGALLLGFLAYEAKRRANRPVAVAPTAAVPDVPSAGIVALEARVSEWEQKYETLRGTLLLGGRLASKK